MNSSQQYRGFTPEELDFNTIYRMSRSELNSLAEKMKLNYTSYKDMNEIEFREFLALMANEIICDIVYDFYKEATLYSKAKLMYSLKTFEESLQKEYEESTFSNILEEHLERFTRLLTKSVIPSVLPERWSYVVSLTKSQFKLHMMHNYSSRIKLDGQAHNPVFGFDADYALIKMPVDTLSIEQYAAQENTTAESVRKWIRRGKLRDVFMDNKEWQISCLAVSPSQERNIHYQPGHYYINEGFCCEDNQFPFLNTAKEIIITQFRSSQRYFIKKVIEHENELIEEDVYPLPIDAKAKENLEMFLLQQKEIESESSLLGTLKYAFDPINCIIK